MSKHGLCLDPSWSEATEIERTIALEILEHPLGGCYAGAHDSLQMAVKAVQFLQHQDPWRHRRNAIDKMLIDCI